MEEIPVTTIVGSWAFGLGIIFGVTVQRTNFCTMGAISDIVFMGSYTRMRAWVMAIGVAILGSQALHMAGLVDLNGSINQTTNFGWAGAILGGLMFGFGMTMAGGCGNKTLVRLGAGNLKSFVVALVLGVSAYMTLRGLIGLPRLQLEAATNIDLTAYGLETQGMIDMIALAIGAEIAAVRPWAALFAGGLLLFWCFKDAEFRGSRRDMAAGLVVGLAIPAGWYVTGVIGNDEFDPVQLFSVTFVSPTADTVQYLMTYTGATINFGVALVGGVILGSFVAAKLAGEFKFESFTDADDMKRHIVGAVLMGVGGIIALGCTIGQAIAGMSTLALSSLIAWMAILAGGYLGLKYLEKGTLAGALGAALRRG